jgi:hypothetical protein
LFTYVVTPPQQTLLPDTVVVVVLVIVFPGGPGKVVVFSIVLVTVAVAWGAHGDDTVDVTVTNEQPELEDELKDADVQSLHPGPVPVLPTP